jgi:hypothetical protein
MRRLRVTFADFKDGHALDAEIILDNEPRDSMVIATPWAEDPTAFFYNQKIIGMRAIGTFSLGDVRHDFLEKTSFGLLDWGRVRRERAAYLERGGVEWDVEFERLAARNRAFKSDLVVYTDGPYSDVPAGRVSFEDDEWIEASRKIRLYHECARVVLRREEPDAIYPIWSEIVGDAVGLIATTGSYDAAAAAQLLGVTPECYSGGKLVRQLGGANIQDVDRVARDVYAVLLRVEADAAKVDPSRPLDLAVKYAHEPYLRF